MQRGTFESCSNASKTENDVDNSKMNDVQQFIEGARYYTHIKELSPAIVNKFVDRVELSHKQLIDVHTVCPIGIFYRSNNYSLFCSRELGEI
jgi:hypothetical protein